MGCSDSKDGDAANERKSSAVGKAGGSGKAASMGKISGIARSWDPASWDVSSGKVKALKAHGGRDLHGIIRFFNKVELFNKLPKDDWPSLAMACEFYSVRTGQVIVSQGDVGSNFYIIKEGEAKVEVAEVAGQPKQVATLKTGDYFGETALLRDEPRTATITATTDVLTLRVTREAFKDLGLNDKLRFPNRKAVGAGGAQRVLEIKPPTTKTRDEKTLIESALKNNANLQAVVELDSARIEAITAIAWRECVDAGRDLITQGDPVADYFYVVQEGCFDIFVSARAEEEVLHASRSSICVSKKVGTVSKGGSFGELALLYSEPRAATVHAQVDSVVWVVDRQNFKSVLMQACSKKLDEYVTYLNQVKDLSPLVAEEKKALARALTEMHYVRDEDIVTQGDEGDTLYVLVEGGVVVKKDGVEKAQLHASRSQKEVRFFGEKSLFSNELRNATVTVTSETANVLALDRGSFDLALGGLNDLVNCKAQYGCGTASLSNIIDLVPSHHRIMRKDLQRIGLLGCGGFGFVQLVEHKVTKATYAMKCLSKGYIVKCGMQECVMNEKTIHMMIDSPFIIKLWETYTGSQTLYFLMEPALGGELYEIYNRKGFHGSQKHAKFYSAGVVKAFEHFHHKHIIYRDTKPENLLLNDMGQMKVADLGLAKFVIGKTYTACGTPDYLAPEIIQSTGYTVAADWWAFGVLLFEFLTGRPPFESAQPMQIYSKVVRGVEDLRFPPKCGGNVEELIKGLLRKEPSQRLPMRPGGVQNLKDHRWYDGFDWAAFTELAMEPPYKPIVKSKKDTSNFEPGKENMPPQIPYHDDGSGWDEGFATM